MEPIMFVSLIIIGFFSGIFGAVIGSSLLIVVPALIFFGLPAHVALGTGKISSLFRDIVALRNYHKGKKVIYGVAKTFTISGILATIVGSFFTLSLSEATLKTIISSFMIIMGVIILFNRKAGLKLKEKKLTRKHSIIGGFLGVIVGLYAGIFGGGVNLLIIFVFVMVLGFDFLSSVATAKIPNILFLTTFIIVFAVNKQIDYIVAIPLVISISIGSYFGSKLALKNGNNFIRWLFIGVVFIMAIKLLIFR